VPRYETFDVLDESQHVAFLCREASHLNIKSVVSSNKLFEAINLFNKSVQVLENELLDPGLMSEPFKSVLESYFASLDKYRLLTFGQQIVRTVAALDEPEVVAEIHKSLKHLIVDEYQDVNPAQEELIRKLVAGGACLTVVGDDDQAIYQWRGSTVRNIISFTERYEGVNTFVLDVNRRSLPDIIGTAARFSRTIIDRLEKEMKPSRSSDDVHDEEQIVSWVCDTEQEEAHEIARLIANLNSSGLPLGRDGAIEVIRQGINTYPIPRATFFNLNGSMADVCPGGEKLDVGRDVCIVACLPE
jgi:DNA helicase-2/ATP-dependent DNA helicase PcrA